MCGPLIALHGRGGLRHGAALHHLGRLDGEAALGAIAGALGGAVDLAGRTVEVQRVAMIIAGAVVIGAGLVALATALGWPRPWLARRGATHEPGGRSPRAFDVAVGRLRRVRPGRRAAMFGAVTALLPCGWLWAFVVTSAGTGHAATGALVMAVFWAGTLPLLVGATVLLAPVIGGLRSRLPVVTAIVLLALGTAALTMRAPLLAPSGAVPSCHRVVAPAGVP
jgi:sulfite exporter TauE/SafE